MSGVAVLQADESGVAVLQIVVTRTRGGCYLIPTPDGLNFASAAAEIASRNVSVPTSTPRHLAFCSHTSLSACTHSLLSASTLYFCIHTSQEMQFNELIAGEACKAIGLFCPTLGLQEGRFHSSRSRYTALGNVAYVYKSTYKAIYSVFSYTQSNTPCLPIHTKQYTLSSHTHKAIHSVFPCTHSNTLCLPMYTQQYTLSSHTHKAIHLVFPYTQSNTLCLPMYTKQYTLSSHVHKAIHSVFPCTQSNTLCLLMYIKQYTLSSQVHKAILCLPRYTKLYTLSSHTHKVAFLSCRLHLRRSTSITDSTTSYKYLYTNREFKKKKKKKKESIKQAGGPAH